MGLAARFRFAGVVRTHYTAVARKFVACVAFACPVHICRILRTAFSAAHLKRAFALAESFVVFRGTGTVFRAGVSSAAVCYAGPLLADLAAFAVAVESFDRIVGALRNAFSRFLLSFKVISVALAFSSLVRGMSRAAETVGRVIVDVADT